ncbi:TIR protein [Gloeothece citriformis PCC 7424]|uniref:TIR protein n=1 Tax=Gloeothece citriformis (strain PCC 7424) TaxID=65393 RepID=B7K9Q8_GLOC7|nr:toll/interleukin-1 receptor domain-containing protein [Gloeothece citriformis]ACK70026.1 TIR protein [Gloeothece citriformis PCC 7424]
METDSSPQVFISYAWRGDSEKIANQLEQAFQNQGITIIRDKTNLGYKGLIKEFMEQIGQGKCILVIISDRYLKSENCMFELVEIAKHGDFYDRIFPIVLEDANIYQATGRLKYIQHWEQQISELESAMKQGNLANLQGITDDLNLYTEIRNNIAQLTNLLKNMNTLTPNLHLQSDFKEIIEAVEARLAQDQPKPAKKSAENNSFKTRMQLMKGLNGIPLEQLEMIMFTLSPPRGIIPPSMTTQGQRVSAFLNWAEGEGGCGLEQVEAVLNEVLNP